MFLKPLGRTLRAARLRRLLFAPAGLEFFAVAGMDTGRGLSGDFTFLQQSLEIFVIWHFVGIVMI